MPKRVVELLDSIEPIDVEDLAEAATEAPAPRPPRDPSAEVDARLAEARATLEHVLDDLSSWRAAQQEVVEAAEAKAARAEREAEELRRKLAEAEGRLSEFDGLKRELRKLISDGSE